jgi:hypothetical protein
MKPPSKHDVSGSANITNLVDNCMIIYRTDKDAKLESGKITEEEYEALPSTMVYCVKQRHHEWEGHWAFWFDSESLKFNGINKIDRRMEEF